LIACNTFKDKQIYIVMQRSGRAKNEKNK